MPLCRPILLTLSNYSFKFVIQKHDQETQPRSHSYSARADVTSPVKYFQYLSCAMRKLRNMQDMTSCAALKHIHCQTNMPCLFITLTTRPEHYIVNIRLFQADLAIKTCPQFPVPLYSFNHRTIRISLVFRSAGLPAIFRRIFSRVCFCALTASSPVEKDLKVLLTYQK